MPSASSWIAARTMSATLRLCPRCTTSAPCACSSRRIMLIAASWPSNREAALTKRSGRKAGTAVGAPRGAATERSALAVMRIRLPCNVTGEYDLARDERQSPPYVAPHPSTGRAIRQGRHGAGRLALAEPSQGAQRSRHQARGGDSRRRPGLQCPWFSQHHPGWDRQRPGSHQADTLLLRGEQGAAPV